MQSQKPQSLSNTGLRDASASKNSRTVKVKCYWFWVLAKTFLLQSSAGSVNLHCNPTLVCSRKVHHLSFWISLVGKHKKYLVEKHKKYSWSLKTWGSTIYREKVCESRHFSDYHHMVLSPRDVLQFYSSKFTHQMAPP